MNLRRLVDFFRDEISVEDFLSGIDSEVDDYRSGLHKRGASVPIYVTEDNFSYVVGRNDVKRLCELYLRDALSEWHLQYICNAIELAASLSTADEKVEGVVFQLASPEVNFPLTMETVSAICGEL